MSSVFVTAFDPFGSARVNASRELALLWASQDPEVALAVVPVVRGLAWRVAKTALQALPSPPRLWLALGEAGPQPELVRLEKVAVNWDDYRLPDNLGARPRDAAIQPDGPAAYFATAPVAAIVASLAGKTPVPVEISLSAGSFLCNHLSYQALHAPLPCPFVFVHIPAWRPEDGPEHLDQLVQTLRAIKDAALR